VSDRPALDLFSPAIRFGAGVAERAGEEVARLGWERVLLVTDVAILAAGIPAAVERSLAASGIWSETLAAPLGEPRDDTIAQLATAASAAAFDGVVAVGGGAVLDVAKLVALLLGDEERELRDYVNPPFGRGLAPPASLLGLVAVPTTAGSGSDVSGVAVLDLVEQGVKTAVSHSALRPRLALVDPATTLSVPPGATAAAGLDVLAHALESLTARPWDDAGLLGSGAVYRGRNPFSDGLCEQALPLLERALPVAVRDGGDLQARTDTMLAATLANLGAAVAGSHAGHALAYAVAAAAKPPGAGREHVPHGFAVALALPGLLAEIELIDPARHERLSRAFGCDDESASDTVERLLDECGVQPLSAYGFVPDDAAGLADAATTQQRLIANTPPGLDRAALQRIADTMLALAH
jgi:alcohol dehydrogenase class IV